jgi:HEXXH motif-containing protein
LVDGLAAGYGGADAIRQLWRAQHSRRLLLLRLFVDEVGPDADSEAAVAAIVAADEGDAAARDVLVEPMVAVWAAATIRSISAGTITKQETAHFAAVAAAAALRGGVGAELRGRTRDGWLYLPATGRLRVSSGDSHVRLRVENGHLWVNGAQVEFAGPAWQERRRLTTVSGLELAVFLEDLDPYRNAYHVPAASRVSPGDLDAWSRGLAETWSILTEYVPDRATELAEGLHSLVPLQKPTSDAAHSATAREAVGVVGLDLPRSAADFAVALVHEFQHSKLSALLDVVALYDTSARHTFFAPWRSDPRPVGGLFQGVYAFLGVADTWRELSADPQRFPSAQREFAAARAQVADAVCTLDASGLLTEPGRRFVKGMMDAVEGLYAHEVPTATVVAAERTLKLRREAWWQTHR